MNKKGFTLIELLAVIVILAVIALITTPIVLGIINDAKEAANKRSVEAYAKAIEYAVIKYEYNNNGELPADYDTIKANVSYSNTPVKCHVAVNCDLKGSVELAGCKVGSYTSTYYKYISTGAFDDTETEPPTGDESVKMACSNVPEENYETDFSGTYVYRTIDNSSWSDSYYSWDTFVRKNTDTNKVELCKIYSNGIVCFEANKWDCDDQEDGHCVNNKGYIESKRKESERKGASCNLTSTELYCAYAEGDTNRRCGLYYDGGIGCFTMGGGCYSGGTSGDACYAW